MSQAERLHAERVDAFLEVAELMLVRAGNHAALFSGVGEKFCDQALIFTRAAKRTCASQPEAERASSGATSEETA